VFPKSVPISLLGCCLAHITSIKVVSEERKRFYLIATLLDPHTKMMSFCDNQYVSSWGKTRVTYFF
jgi:hypothetical protein